MVSTAAARASRMFEPGWHAEGVPILHVAAGGSTAASLTSLLRRERGPVVPVATVPSWRGVEGTVAL